MKLNLTKKQQVLLGVTVLLVPWALCHLYGAAIMRQSPLFRDPAMPQVNDLYLAVAMAGAFISVRLALVKSLRPFTRSVLPPGKREIAFRVDRFGTQLFDLLHYIVITAVGFGLMIDEKWFPVTLGGQGDVLASIRMYDEPPSTGLKLYLLAEFGYQLHNFIFVILLKPIGGDTMDFVLHDFAAMALIAGTYLSNYTTACAIAVFVNDVCDFFQCIYLIATDLGPKGAVAPLLVAVVASWGYLRLYLVPRDCLYNYITVMAYENPNMSMLFIHPMNTLFAVIVALHAHWLLLHVKKGVRVLRGAATPTTPTAKKIQTK